MNSNKKVCNLHHILYFRLIFGYYFKQPTLKLRILTKLYIALFISGLTWLFITKVNGMLYYLQYCDILEYITFIIYSLITEDSSLLRSYEEKIKIDSLPVAKQYFRQLEKFLYLLLFLICGLRLFASSLFCIYAFEICKMAPFGVSVTNTFLTAMDWRHLNTVIWFSLLQTRVKILKNTLEIQGFDRGPMQRFSPRMYIKMYEELVGFSEFNGYAMKSIVRITSH
ncbi:hypothetical protein B5X24_HaOG200882 [Helicoverpa armigera]|uniref:Odorant receptor n=1 Tax=Helicoverpa armigera TaxID=29058 RepID=A0A2W1BFB7_HELAM|nr:hypothetical protein B5X24_HaOG200882 [Helicoverpa armigera]